MDPWHVPVLAVGGFACGVLNALAGGGSFVTLPLLLLIGLPPQVANATNRVAIVLQTAAGAATYHRHGVLPWRFVPRLAVPLVLGAIPGALLAAYIDESVFRKAAAVLFGLMALTVFVNPRKWVQQEGEARVRPILYPILFVLGLYGGFLQAGVGVLLISSFVLVGGFDAVRGNALKFSLAFLFTLAALLLFTGAGQVRWLPGLALGIGTIAGGIVGARLVIAKGGRWVRVFVIVAAVGAIVKLLQN